MGGDEHALAAQDVRLDVVDVVGPDAGAGVAERLAAGRRDGVGAAPDVDLLLAPFRARVVLVEAGEIAVVALVERLVAGDRAARSGRARSSIRSSVRWARMSAEVKVTSKLRPFALSRRPALARLGDALLG